MVSLDMCFGGDTLILVDQGLMGCKKTVEPVNANTNTFTKYKYTSILVGVHFDIGGDVNGDKVNVGGGGGFCDI